MIEALTRVGLADFADAYPRQLSGGMRMRVSIARALVTAPRLLLMDEPFAALDEITRFKLNDDLIALWRELGMTVVFVTHSVFESVFLSQRIVVMTARPGRVFSELAIDAPGRDARFRTSAEYAGYCRVVSEALAQASAAPAGARGMNGEQTAHERREKVLRALLPIAVLALGVLGWDLVVRLEPDSALHPAVARPRDVDAHLRLVGAVGVAARHA